MPRRVFPICHEKSLTRRPRIQLTAASWHDHRHPTSVQFHTCDFLRLYILCICLCHAVYVHPSFRLCVDGACAALCRLIQQVHHFPQLFMTAGTVTVVVQQSQISPLCLKAVRISSDGKCKPIFTVFKKMAKCQVASSF